MSRIAVLLLCTFFVLAAGQDGTVKPANTTVDAEIPASDALPTPTPETKYADAPIPTATPDSTTFRKVPTFECSDAVSIQVATIYSKNRDIFDACADSSEYQIFPFSGHLPTQVQIHALATTPSCTALFTACVMANMPQCDISALGLKAVVESLLKITVDIDNGLPTPNTELFHEIHTWRRDVNLAQQAGLPYGNDSELYGEFTRNLWTALTRYNVHVMPDLSIVYNATELTNAVNGAMMAKPNTTLYNTTFGVSLDAGSGSRASEDIKAPGTGLTKATSSAVSLRSPSIWLWTAALSVLTTALLMA